MTEKEIFEIENTRPHVVILGAGQGHSPFLTNVSISKIHKFFKCGV